MWTTERQFCVLYNETFVTSASVTQTAGEIPIEFKLCALGGLSKGY